MTNIIAVATVRPRRIALVALVAALLSAVAFAATPPTPAHATAQWNPIDGWNVSPYPFAYTREPPPGLVRMPAKPVLPRALF